MDWKHTIEHSTCQWDNIEQTGTIDKVPEVETSPTIDISKTPLHTRHRRLFWKGRFHIEGFSFKGAVPGELVFGPNNQLQFSPHAPSGLPIMSHMLEDDVCALFDLDGVQYRGSQKSLSRLTEGALPLIPFTSFSNPIKNISQMDGIVQYTQNPNTALDVDTKRGLFECWLQRMATERSRSGTWQNLCTSREPMNGLFEPTSINVRRQNGEHHAKSMRR